MHTHDFSTLCARLRALPDALCLEIDTFFSHVDLMALQAIVACRKHAFATIRRNVYRRPSVQGTRTMIDCSVAWLVRALVTFCLQGPTKSNTCADVHVWRRLLFQDCPWLHATLTTDPCSSVFLLVHQVDVRNVEGHHTESWAEYGARIHVPATDNVALVNAPKKGHQTLCNRIVGHVIGDKYKITRWGYRDYLA